MTAKSGRLSAAGILADILDRPVETIPADASIFNFPAWDSLAHVRLMLALEDVTGNSDDPARIAMLSSLEEVDRYLEEKFGGGRL
jgi:acyl carrier protein